MVVRDHQAHSAARLTEPGNLTSRNGNPRIMAETDDDDWKWFTGQGKYRQPPKVERVADQRTPRRMGSIARHLLPCILFFTLGAVTHDRAWSFALAFVAGYELCRTIDSVV